MEIAEEVRTAIDTNLAMAGWVIQDMKDLNVMASSGVAVRDYPTSSGATVDYLLFILGTPCGVIQAQPLDWDGSLTVEAASGERRFEKTKFTYVPRDVFIRFVYEASDKIIMLTDQGDKRFAPHWVFNFLQPKSMKEYLTHAGTIRNYLADVDAFNKTGFPNCQIDSLERLDKSLAAGNSLTLVELEQEKDSTPVTAAYRLVKYGHMNKVLYLVDDDAMMEEAQQDFTCYKPGDNTNRSFANIYAVHKVQGTKVPDGCKVYICTPQRLYTLVTGLTEPPLRVGSSLQIGYNRNFPPEYFDCILFDRCRSSVYADWVKLIWYFDAFMVGFALQPDWGIRSFFNENVV